MTNLMLAVLVTKTKPYVRNTFEHTTCPGAYYLSYTYMTGLVKVKDS
jgi:hypothetical protein